MRALPALLLVLALAWPAAAGAAAAPRASLPDIEDEVMCLECKTALNVSTSKVADGQRAFIRELIAQGRTKEQVKAALVAEYGPRVLARPEGSGFSLAAWTIPLLAGLGALALLVVLARRWRRPAAAGEAGSPAGAAAPAAASAPEIDPDDTRRLDAELAAFDR
jgi:cytochrome c-type biogenesis protein CcmH